MKNTKYVDVNVDKRLEQFLISCILGDGSFCKISGAMKNSKLSIAHGIKQKEYIYYKYNLLKEYYLVNTISYNKIYNDRYQNGFIEEYRFKSKSHPIFTEIRNKYYDLNGKKRIFEEFITNLNDYGLALWYMDDGFATKCSSMISTCSFSLEERIILQKILFNNFKIETTVDKNDNSIYILEKSFPLFKSIIEPHILTSMNYKLIPYKYRENYGVLNKSDKLLESPKMDNQQPIISLND